MQFNMLTLWTRRAFGRVARMFKARQAALAYKRRHLREMWDREVQLMMHACQKKAKHKKFKALHAKLAQFNDIKTETFLQEYFRMCRTAYLLKAQTQQTWSKTHRTEAIIDLYQTDVVFHRRQMDVQQSLFNLFEGTDASEPVLGTLKPQEERLKPKARRRATLKAPGASGLLNPTLPTQASAEPREGHPVPKRTEILDDILFVASRYSTIHSADFQIQLQKVAERDPEIIARVLPRAAPSGSDGTDGGTSLATDPEEDVSVKDLPVTGEYGTRGSHASQPPRKSAAPYTLKSRLSRLGSGAGAARVVRSPLPGPDTEEKRAQRRSQVTFRDAPARSPLRSTLGSSAAATGETLGAAMGSVGPNPSPEAPKSRLVQFGDTGKQLSKQVSLSP